jgi:hypothetical protein
MDGTDVPIRPAETARAAMEPGAAAARDKDQIALYRRHPHR